ncbi:glycosyltransferase family 20-domain-containing protein [Pelagophyceae sp. CCMP2097]|nr:glycosyltransferase family 20-domain-containing protein [Pelagophyceae sp. CCMP2097]
MPTPRTASRDSLTRLLEDPAGDEDDERQNDLDGQEAYVLEQLQHLHDELASKRAEQRTVEKELSESAETASSARTIVPPNKLIVVACNKPVRLEKPHGVDYYEYSESRGSLKAAIDSLEKAGNAVRWVSWPGTFVEKTSQEGVRTRLNEEFNCRPVFLNRELEESFYVRFCKGVLWPLFHCIPSMSTLSTAAPPSPSDEQRHDGQKGELVGARATDQYDAYVSVNQLFLEAIAEEYVDGDLVVVYDYELMLLPAMLRKRFPDVVCGYFLQCPFPSSEFYRMLPAREALLQGTLGADLVSLNHFDYARHYLNACMRVLGLESSPSRLEYNGRVVTVSISPAGINPDEFDNCGVEQRAEIDAIAGRMRSGVFKRPRKIIVSLDQLDMCKGIPQKIMAMEALLESHPEWRGHATLVLAARDRGRPYNAQLRKAVDGLVGKVNGRFGRADYCPVHYVKHTLARAEVNALYSIADVVLVASVREGINLSAMEFVACQAAASAVKGEFSDKDGKDPQTVGVLVYSEFAGCATSFGEGALVVNPYDTDAVAAALHQALTMSRTTKQVRHHKLARYVNTYTAELWAQRLVRELRLARDKAKEYTYLLPLDVAQLRSFYERSRRRLLIFDYDGALSPQASTLPQLAQPSGALTACLRALCADEANTVYILSGRKRTDLRGWLGGEARLGLVAEYGYWLKYARGDASACTQDRDQAAAQVASAATRSPGNDAAENEPAVSLVRTPSCAFSDMSDVSEPVGERQYFEPARERVFSSGVDLSWHEEVFPMLESFTRFTPGSFLEANQSCLAWHYSEADPEFGASQAKDLQLHLDVILANRPVRVVTLPKCIVLHSSRISKGRALRAAVDGLEAYDLILAIGDDDDVFELLGNSTHAFLCTVGRKLTRAPYSLDEDDVLPMLQTLAAVSAEFQAAAAMDATAEPRTPTAAADDDYAPTAEHYEYEAAA